MSSLSSFDEFVNTQQDVKHCHLGKDGCTKSDVFSEKFQTAFDPPPHFRKIMLQMFIMDMVEYMQGGTRAR